jgi:hypothetical protein
MRKGIAIVVAPSCGTWRFTAPVVTFMTASTELVLRLLAGMAWRRPRHRGRHFGARAERAAKGMVEATEQVIGIFTDQVCDR